MTSSGKMVSNCDNTQRPYAKKDGTGFAQALDIQNETSTYQQGY